MKWEQAKNVKGALQPEGIQCGEYRIGRFNGGTRYRAWFKYELVADVGTASEAKAECEKHLSLSVQDSGTGRSRSGLHPLPKDEQQG